MATRLLQEASQIPIGSTDRVIIYSHLAEIYINHPDTFNSYMTQAFDLLEEVKPNDLLLSKLYHQLADFHSNTGNDKLALENHRKYSFHLGETIKKDFSTTIKELKQENHIRHLHTQNLQLIVTRQQTQLTLLIVCLGAIIIISIVFYRFKRKKQELLEAEQKIEILQDMASQDNHEKNSLRNIVLQHFKLLKKVAQLQPISSTLSSSKTVIEKFNNIVYSQDTMDWDIFYSTINTAHSNLCDRIRKKFPTLKESEFKVICLTIAKFSNPEIAVILNKSPHTIPGIKSLIRKKIGIVEQGNIANFFLHYWEESSKEEK